MTEQWREAVPGRVMVSDFGRVMLIGPAKVKARPKLGYKVAMSKTTFYYKLPVKGTNGHKAKNYNVHRLVCEAFHGPAPFPGAIVMHLDEDGLNNRADNLAWGTQKQNLNMPKLKAYQQSRIGDLNPRRIAAAKKMG